MPPLAKPSRPYVLLVARPDGSAALVRALAHLGIRVLRLSPGVGPGHAIDSASVVIVDLGVIPMLDPDTVARLNAARGFRPVLALSHGPWPLMTPPADRLCVDGFATAADAALIAEFARGAAEAAGTATLN